MTHQPWPGERLSLYDVVQLSGSAPVYSTPGLYSSLDWYEDYPTGTDTSVTVTVGDDFYLMSNYPRLLLSDSSDPIGECNWIVDASAGSAVVNFYTGYDTGWSYPSPGSITWTLVGSLTVDTSGRKLIPLPMGDRNWSRLYDVGSPLLRVEVVSGSVDLRVGYLQVEPPGGLQEALTYTNGSWVTPAEQLSTAALQQRVHNRYNLGAGTSTIQFMPTGSYNVGPGAPSTDYISASTLLGMLNSSLSTQAGGSIADSSWITVSSGDMGANCISPSGTIQIGSTAGGVNCAAISGQRSNLEMKSLWNNITTTFSTDGYTGILGRDTVENSGSYFDYNGTSSSVGWRPGFMVPVGKYHEDGFSSSGAYTSDTGASPHGEAHSLSGTSSATMNASSYPKNTRANPAVNAWPSTAVDVISVTPVFGVDVVMTGENTISSFATPNFADWGVYEASTYPYVSNAFSGGGWIWCYQDLGGNYSGSRPQLRVQPPDYREHIPVWTLAPDYVPSSSPPPFTGDSSSDAGEYTYEGDVGTGTVPPILWFLYKKWGFLGDHVVAYGQGLGNSQAALHGVLKLGPGTTYPVVGDVTPTIVSWTLSPAGTHAYDGTGVIFAGTDAAPPRVDSEVQVIEFIVPTGYPLDSPTSNHVYVENDNGRSNALQLLLYPMVDIDMASPDPDNVSYTASMGIWDPADAPALAQHYSLFTIESMVLSGRIPERAPLFLGAAAPACTFTGGVPTTGLDDPVDVAIPLLLRYRPLDSKITPRPDLGTGISVWDSNETSTMDWKFHVDSAPFVDSSAEVASRNGPIVRPALVFPGDAWCETTNGFSAGPTLTCVMVVKVYPDAQERSYLLSSFVSGTPDPDTFPLEVFVSGDQVCLRIGGRLNVTKIPQGYIGQRPIIVGISLNADHLTWAVVAATGTVRDIAHAPMTSAGLKLYLGRSNDAGNLQMATMDVLDMSLDVAFKATNPMWTVINRFDSAYGVMA